MIGRALLFGVLVAGVAAAQGLDVSFDGYRASQKVGGLGGVGGRAFVEGRRVDGPDQPLAGVAIVVVPRSAAFLARLAEIKARARDGMETYRGSAPALRRARDEYERALWEAGAADLVHAAVADAAGRFRLEGIPAGDWVLVAMHSVFVDRPSPPSGKKERQTYTRPPRLTGYQAVTVWLRELSIAGGLDEVVELTDRNGWFSGVVEERTLDADG